MSGRSVAKLAKKCGTADFYPITHATSPAPCSPQGPGNGISCRRLENLIRADDYRHAADTVLQEDDIDW
ncbi:MAG: hypothetical protein H6662_02855 [Ardenticatenaceae bacterium]|nr:hypothetical protein [Ardenticatenaceae bacterium]